jgi:hypothetical protein
MKGQKTFSFTVLYTELPSLSWRNFCIPMHKRPWIHKMFKKYRIFVFSSLHSGQYFPWRMGNTKILFKITIQTGNSKIVSKKVTIFLLCTESGKTTPVPKRTSRDYANFLILIWFCRVRIRILSLPESYRR